MINIKKVELNDIYNIYTLDSNTFGAESYKKDDFINYVNDKDSYFISIYNNDEFIGYALIKLIKPECELLKICINKNKRNNHYGKELLLNLINFCKNNEFNKIFLEVRSDNTIAIKFYENNGFIKYNIRNNYYKNPTSDAVLYYKNL